MNKALPRVRSRVHFVGLCAKCLLRDQSQIQEYIREYFSPLEVENVSDKVLDNENQQHPEEPPLEAKNASNTVLDNVNQ
jgi:hypothetical protein